MTTQTKTKPVTAPLTKEAQTASLNKLFLDELNVRQDYNQESIEGLAANILAQGQLQNLLVRKRENGKFGVVAGGRRLKAMQLLQSQKKIKATFPVKLVIVDDKEALEVSIAENTHREEIHPADQFIAWDKLHQSGHSVAEIAKTHGTTESKVLKRLKLGGLHPEILRQYKNDELSEQSVMAFTLSSSQEEQLAVLKVAGNNPRSIKANLTSNEVHHRNFMVQYVGVEFYQKAGGQIRTDLFSDDVFLIDSQLLEKLAKAKLEEDKAALLSEGWSWVKELDGHWYAIADKYDRIYPEGREFTEEETARLYEINSLVEAAHENDEDFSDKIEALESERDTIQLSASGFNQSQMQGYGCYYYISGDGKFKVEAGLKLKVKSKKKAEKPQTVSGLSGSLENDLKQVRKECIKAVCLENPTAFIDYAQFELIRKFLGGESIFLGLDNDAFKQPHDQWDKAPFEVTRELDALGDITSDEVLHDYKLPKWLKSDVKTAFAAYQKMDAKAKARLFAYALSYSLGTSWKNENCSNEGIEILLGQLNFEPRKYWKPDASFFKRLSKPQMLELTEELVGSKVMARMAGCKKSDIAEELAAIFAANIGKHPDVQDQKTFERIAYWSPIGMR